MLLEPVRVGVGEIGAASRSFEIARKTADNRIAHHMNSTSPQVVRNTDYTVRRILVLLKYKFYVFHWTRKR